MQICASDIVGVGPGWPVVAAAAYSAAGKNPLRDAVYSILMLLYSYMGI